MNRKQLHFAFNSPLNGQDSETQTYGCRANNPDICANCYLPGVCAFSSDDNLCKKPSRAWKKQYQKLREESYK